MTQAIDHSAPVKQTDSDPAAAKATPIAGPEGQTTTPAPHGISAVQGLAASANVVEFAPGLYALTIGETRETRREVAGMIVPATHVGGVASEGSAGLEIVGAANGPAAWLGPDGGTLVVKAPATGCHVLITTYRPAGQEAVPLAVQIARLDRPRPKAAATGTAQVTPPPAVPEQAAPAARELTAEVILHIEKQGDRRFTSGDWNGDRGSKQRIEAFAIRAPETLAPNDIEYKAFGPNGRETPWMTDGEFCGTRGRGMPLTGFAIRLAPHLRERLDVLYAGAFFESGTSSQSRNGEPCRPARADDSLEAVNVRLVERVDK